MGETQDRCCLAGVRLERDDLIQACLVHDGQTEKQLELTDMNECIERDVQHMKYQLSDGVPVDGYSPIVQIKSTQIVDNDVCCKRGCDFQEFEGLLGGCASVESSPNPPTYDLNAGFGICSSKTIYDDTYFFSTGE